MPKPENPDVSVSVVIWLLFFATMILLSLFD